MTGSGGSGELCYIQIFSMRIHLSVMVGEFYILSIIIERILLVIDVFTDGYM